MSWLVIAIGLGLFLLLCHAQIRQAALAVCAFLPRLIEALEELLEHGIDAVWAKLRSVGAPSPLRILIGVIFLVGAVLCAMAEYPILVETFKLIFPSDALAALLALIGVVLPALVAFLLYSPADGPPPVRAAWVVAVLLVLTVGALAFWRQLKIDEAELRKERLLRAQVESATGAVQIEGRAEDASIAQPLPAATPFPWWLNPLLTASLAVLFSIGNQLCFHAAFKQAGSGMVLVAALPLWLALGGFWIVTSLLNRSGLLTLPGAIVLGLLDCVQRLVTWITGLPAAFRLSRQRRANRVHLDELATAEAAAERKAHAMLIDLTTRSRQMSAEQTIRDREKVLRDCADGRLVESEQDIQRQLGELRTEVLKVGAANRAELDRQRRLLDSPPDSKQGKQS